MSCCPKALQPVRPLSPEESALWAKVASTICPLHREKSDPEAVQIIEKPKTRAASALAPIRRPPPPRERRGVGTTLDGSWDRRLSGGNVEPDRIVDLHGMGLDSAWSAIDRALERAVGEGERVVLLITGHQRSGEPPLRRGAIRAAVHDWLSASRHAVDIAAVRGAHRRHGGGGSLYIILRRKSHGR
jgi:DNA-nicking Smr family endonuclease